MLRVKFVRPTIKKEAETLMVFCMPNKLGWNWSPYIYKSHPMLGETLENTSKKEFFKTIHTYSREYIRNRHTHIENTIAEYQKKWDKINNAYLQILSKHLEVDFPKNRRVMYAYVSIVPIYPRYLDEWSFNVSWKDKDAMLSISMHEILHFFYFKKWMEVFPKTKRKELDNPHLVWRLSEILDPIILNNNPDIQKLLKRKTGHYEEFQKIKIGNKTMIKHFEDLYKKHLKSNKSFEDFLRTCWNEAVKHKKIIESS